MSKPLLSLICLILQQHDKVSPDHCRNMQGVAMVSQKDLSTVMCVSAAARMHVEGSLMGVCVGCWVEVEGGGVVGVAAEN